MRIEHRRYESGGKEKVIHVTDTNESRGFVKVILPNGKEILLDDGQENSIEILSTAGAELSVLPRVSNSVEIRVESRKPKYYQIPEDVG